MEMEWKTEWIWNGNGMVIGNRIGDKMSTDWKWNGSKMVVEWKCNSNGMKMEW
jgi:hypothetical protein